MSIIPDKKKDYGNKNSPNKDIVFSIFGFDINQMIKQRLDDL